MLWNKYLVYACSIDHTDFIMYSASSATSAGLYAPAANYLDYRRPTTCSMRSEQRLLTGGAHRVKETNSAAKALGRCDGGRSAVEARCNFMPRPVGFCLSRRPALYRISLDKHREIKAAQ